jgi:hypothetical protein
MAVDAVSAQMRNVEFVENSFNGWTDFFVFRYSVACKGSVENSRLLFHGIVVRATYMWESMWNVFALIFYFT